MSFTETPVAESALLAVQTAIVARCEEHLSVPIYDWVPEDASYPYVTTGEATETADNVHGRFGRRVTHTMHVWDSGRHGFADALGIVTDLARLFDHRETAVPIEGHRFRSIRLQDARPMRDPDPLIRHVPTTFVFLTEQDPP